MNDYDALSLAADIMKQRGKAEYTIHDNETGKVCLRGAILCAKFGSPQWRGLGDTSEVGCESYVADAVDADPVDWNNQVATEDQVISGLDAGAQLAMQEAGIEPEDYYRSRR